ncbi:hypothetical protein JIQ42_01800 [Leishmania sp. Namibia]|uniref:hypothetical protein n=1 Tax=Leishmania sp. Namibia TaxID=2802991 RepID=UPI001B527D73|nr:hypothetical protein JIQ42_01800 [Leishmania sp. Namibia]
MSKTFTSTRITSTTQPLALLALLLLSPVATLTPLAFGLCRVWRPVEVPPLPRYVHRANSTSEGGAEVVDSGDEPSARATAHTATRTGTAATASRLSSSFVVAQSARKATRTRGSPPHGQLIDLGKGGIDDILKNGREAQRLFYSLPAQRLTAAYGRSQAALRQELDQQREYKRMLELAEYQAELVNIFGNTMRDSIADAFFDDGSDSVLSALQRKKGRGPKRT